MSDSGRWPVVPETVYGTPVSLRTIQVGDELHGYCGGYFGRDDYDCGIVEAIGHDWVIKRPKDFYGDRGTARAATGKGILQELAEYRIPNPYGCDMGQCPMRGWQE